jgi:signal transduction histidine kinase
VAAFFTRRRQLQWLALLAITIVLPTVSLLWFMSKVISNEKFVVRQKLSALYQDRVAEASTHTGDAFQRQLASLDQINVVANPYSYFRQLVLEHHVEGLVVWDSGGNLTYPRSAELIGEDSHSDNPLAAAGEFEFAKKEYEDALRLYNGFVNDENPRVAVAAINGKTRCLQKMDRVEEAITECKAAAFRGTAENSGLPLRLAIENSRLLLLALTRQCSQPQEHSALVRQTIQALHNDLYHPGSPSALLPPNHNLFIARKVTEFLQGDAFSTDRQTLQTLQTLVAAERLSIDAAERMRVMSDRLDTFSRIDLGDKKVYCLWHRSSSGTFLVLLSDSGMAAALYGYYKAFAGSESTYRILDATGNLVVGTAQPKEMAFATAALPEGFPGWKAELFFKGSDVFEKAAKRQIAVYTWTGFLVIVLIVAAGGFAMRAVGRQIRLNEMKNDFIATVSHELKTPLASMRVLVDTLLEGNVRDEQQAKEYLRLTARENERLSRMIDNFLTFSRMERNKKAFNLAEANPRAIANDAVESVKTKFTAQNCHLTVDVAAELPDIQADHDAMVTVLVNLLDNACKYTTENKQTALKVYGNGGVVCFAVSDNGIGLARKHLKKVFDSFYQVDSSLARKVEGCGLGLSIVKFIVDAHRGTIDIDSKLGQGSTFTVKLPVRHPQDE